MGPTVMASSDTKNTPRCVNEYRSGYRDRSTKVTRGTREAAVHCDTKTERSAAYCAYPEASWLPGVTAMGIPAARSGSVTARCHPAHMAP